MKIITTPEPPKIEKPTKKYSYVVIFIFITLYIMFMVGKSLWEHFKINREIDAMRIEVEIAKENNKKLENQIAYYQTESFIEKEARQKLGYKKPDEKVILLPIPKEQETNRQEQEQNTQTISKQQNKPNYIRWYEYFFK